MILGLFLNLHNSLDKKAMFEYNNPPEVDAG